MMNHLQLISGYTQLGNQERLKEKVSEVVDVFDVGRKLFSLNCPKFIIFITFFNHHFSNMHLENNISIENIDLSTLDNMLYEESNEIMRLFTMFDDTFMYNWVIDVTHCEETETIRVMYALDKADLAIPHVSKLLDTTQFTLPIEVKEEPDFLEISFIISDNY